MAEQTVIEGVALAFHQRSYDGFTDRQTGEVRPGGITRTLWVGKSFEQEPLQVKVGDALEAQVGVIKRGDNLRATCSLYANGRALRYVLDAVQVVPAQVSAKS